MLLEGGGKNDDDERFCVELERPEHACVTWPASQDIIRLLT